MWFNIGITLIILSFVAAMNPYFLIYAIPVFSAGALFIWLSKRKLKTKVLWTMIPLLAWYPAMLLFLLAYTAIGKANAQKLDFIFEEDFRGRVIVISNSPCGQKVVIKDGREQLYIPENGILLYQGEIEAGIIDHRYFRRTNQGKLIPIPENHARKEGDPEPHVVCVWLGGIVTGHVAIPKPAIDYVGLMMAVASADSVDTYYEHFADKTFREQTHDIVRECEIHRPSY